MAQGRKGICFMIKKQTNITACDAPLPVMNRKFSDLMPNFVINTGIVPEGSLIFNIYSCQSIF